MKKERSATTMYVFDRYAKRYDRWYDKPFGKTAFKLEMKCIQILCEDLKRPFLEVGVGTGRFAAELNIEYGVDRSIGVLKLAKKREVECVKGVGEELPFTSNSFGAVFFIVTLCFVEDPSRVLKEAERVLINEGRIILGIMLKGSPWTAFYAKKAEAGNVFYKMAEFYTLNEVQSIIDEAHFEIEDVASTILQAPTEKPLLPEEPKRGYHREAGFVAIKAKKKC